MFELENKKVIIECKKRYFRPLEVDYLKGNASKAKKQLKWYPKTNFKNGIKLTFDWYNENRDYYKKIPKKDILNYLEAILTTYNQEGRRDNIYKARIKILVRELGIEKFRSLVEENFSKLSNKELVIDDKSIEEIFNVSIEKHSLYFYGKKIKNEN